MSLHQLCAVAKPLRELRLVPLGDGDAVGHDDHSEDLPVSRGYWLRVPRPWAGGKPGGFLRVAAALDRGAEFHELIAVTAGGGAPLVALAGHLRLTVYALRPDWIPNPLTVVLSASPRM